MKSSTTSDFWAGYNRLPVALRQQARKAYRLWQENPRHTSLRFEKKGDFWSVRVSRSCRALGREHEGTLYWFWIGSHDEYERLILTLRRSGGQVRAGEFVSGRLAHLHGQHLHADDVLVGNQVDVAGLAAGGFVGHNNVVGGY